MSDNFVNQLKTALNKHQLDKVAKLMKEDLSFLNDDQAENVSKLLRGKKQHKYLEKATSVFRDTLPNNNLIKIHRAQSLIELNQKPQAMALLKNIRRTGIKNKRVNSEVNGLIGRIHKQNFIEHNDKNELEKSIGIYHKQWQTKQDDYRWHGINLVALAARAQKEGISTKTNIDYKILANEISTEIEQLDKEGKADSWDYATAFESSIALKNNKKRNKWLKKYIHDKNTDAFELNSTLRQLREIWQLENSPVGEEIIPVIEHAILSKTGGTLEIKDPSIDSSSTKVFEAVWGSEGSVQKQWLESLFKMLDSVAKVSDRNTGTAHGTGFLINGKHISNKLSNEVVFVTNSHVISDKAIDKAALETVDATAEFTTLPTRPRVKIGKQVFYSPKNKLDISVHQIKHPKEALVLDPTIHMPIVPKTHNDAPMRIYVIGHPKGGDISITLYGNKLKDIQLPYFHYESPTEGGSSGSPVFNRNLKLIGLHHAALLESEVNEGIAFSSIIKKSNKKKKNK